MQMQMRLQLLVVVMVALEEVVDGVVSSPGDISVLSFLHELGEGPSPSRTYFHPWLRSPGSFVVVVFFFVE